MSKYIKLEDALKGLNMGYGKYDYVSKVADYYNNLPTIEVSEEELKGCDKVDKRSSEDAISREDAVNALIAHFIPQTYTGEQVEQASKLARKIMDNAPSVIPQPKEGEWIYIDEPIIGNPYGRYRCSECELEEPHKTNYCPNCGAKMKGAE